MTEDIAWQLKQPIQRHPRLSNVKLAKLLGISESYVRKLKEKLDL
jgi:DNA-binding Lrp family transcriptional regulator